MSSSFPSEYLLLPLDEMKKIKDKKYPHINMKDVMKARKREKNRNYVKKTRERKKEKMKQLFSIIKQQEDRINFLMIENEILTSIVNQNN